jgi:hypothetical protein
LERKEWKDIAIVAHRGVYPDGVVQAGSVVIYADVPYEIFAGEIVGGDDEYELRIAIAEELARGPMRQFETLARAKSLEDRLRVQFDNEDCGWRFEVSTEHRRYSTVSAENSVRNTGVTQLVATSDCGVRLSISASNTLPGAIGVAVRGTSGSVKAERVHDP